MNNYRNPGKKGQGPLGPKELLEVENSLATQFQNTEFSTWVTVLISSTSISNNSQILNLSTYLDSKGIIRVGRRLENSGLSHSSKCPILLSSKSKLTEIIVRYCHKT